MAKLTIDEVLKGGLSDTPVKVPSYDILKMREITAAEPVWLHFGAGNIFRIFIARLDQTLIEKGVWNKGIIAADTFDGEIIEKIYDPHDNLTLAADMRSDGNISFEVVASVSESVNAASGDKDSNDRLVEIACAPSLQMISFTMTEKGYALRGIDGSYLSIVSSDIENGPDNCIHAMSRVCALLLKRFESGKTPVALVSMDNCSHNGEKLRGSILEIASEWNKNGFVSDEFISWISDESNVSFPWSMIDKITPRPDKEVQSRAEEAGIEDMAPITTSRGTFIAPFVNAEIPQYLVIEDTFPNGRPPLEDAGVYMTDRDTVNKVEKMKVTTCLNPLHTSLAVFGCLLGYTRISDEMKDEDLNKLVRALGYDEAMKVVTDPGIIRPEDFINEVIDERLPNPYIPDAPQRIATDTSLKIPIRFGETIKSYIESPSLDVRDLTYVPLTIAGWIRYLLAVDDNGDKFDPSSDPMLATLQNLLQDVVWNDPSTLGDSIDPILRNEIIFGTDLVACGLSDKITKMLSEMLEGKGSVRRTIQKYI